MNEEIKTQYKEYPIIYNEGNNQFEAFVDGNKAFSDGSLRNLREKIDNFEKAQSKKDFKRFKVLVSKSNGWTKPDTYIEGEVTSITEDGRYWVTANGNRTLNSIVIPMTESNIANTNKIAEVRNKIMLLQEELKHIEQSLETLTKGAKPKE